MSLRHYTKEGDTPGPAYRFEIEIKASYTKKTDSTNLKIEGSFEVRQCKLDPSLKALVSNFDC